MIDNPQTPDPTPESARALLYRYGLPEDVIDGALCLHAQELAAAIRNHPGAIPYRPQLDEDGGFWWDLRDRDAAADLIDPTRADNPAVLPAVPGPPTTHAGAPDRDAEIERLREQLEEAEDTAEQLVRNVQTVAREREGYRRAWKEEQQRRVKAEHELRRMADEAQQQEPGPGAVLIEDYLKFLRGQGPEPDLSDLPPEQREAAVGQFEIVKALADRDPSLPPLDRDPVARRLGLHPPADEAQQQEAEVPAHHAAVPAGAVCKCPGDCGHRTGAEAQQQPDTETPCLCGHVEPRHRRQRPGWTREACSDCPCVDYVAGEPSVEAQPPYHRWSVETRDAVADQWTPGTPITDRDKAVERYEHATKNWPTWKDGTAVQRRLIRATTTYTVEAATAAAHVGGNAEDCPACHGTNPPYPFICPGSDAKDGAQQ